jgi:hypothetical protein
MKKWVGAIALVASQVSFGATLQCWKTNFTEARTPFMTAKILSNSRLSNIEFPYQKSGEENTPGPIKATKITSNHSPYKGDNAFYLKNGDTLVLPADLSKDNLDDVKSGGIGFYKDENGAIIGFSSGDSEGGNHYSIRLDCSSDK